MEYNEELKQYGIDENIFQSIISKSKEINADLFLKILGAADIKTEESFLTLNEAKKIFGEISKEELVSKMKSYEEQQTKVSEYEKILQSAVENAIKNGVKAKGNNFDEKDGQKYLKDLHMMKSTHNLKNGK